MSAQAAMQDERTPPWPRAAASAAIFRGGEVLLIQRGKEGPLQGLWSFPGGRIEPGEPVRTAVLREVREEAGVVAELAGVLDVRDVFRRDPEGRVLDQYLLAVFYGRWVSGDPVAGDDAMAARFVPLDAVHALPTTDGAPDLIRRAAALLEATPG
jgi:ADP-ribose pyrophosphatase YjhB (NUDIX family)